MISIRRHNRSGFLHLLRQLIKYLKGNLLKLSVLFGIIVCIVLSLWTSTIRQEDEDGQLNIKYVEKDIRDLTSKNLPGKLVKDEQWQKGSDDEQQLTQLNNKEELYSKRRNVMLSKCAELQTTNNVTFWYTIDHRHNAIFCPIPKVASSFFRLLLGITGSTKLTKNFTANYFSPRLYAPFKNTKVDLLKRTYVDYKSAMFVRDPWWRIYSAYINKIYMPQVVYWEIFGKQAVRHARKNPSEKSLRCGDDATFPEFIKFVIFLHGLKRTVDLHLVTYYERCAPCEMKYEMIGKLETFHDDVDTFRDYISVSSFMEKTYSADYRVFDVRQTTIEVADSFNKDISKCIDINEALSRLWFYFKLRGRFDPDLPEPTNVTNKEKGRFMRDALVNATRAAAITSKSAERNRFKLQAFRMAYQLIPLKDKLKLIEIYKNDFEMFDYDKRPYDVFESIDRNENIKLFLP